MQLQRHCKPQGVCSGPFPRLSVPTTVQERNLPMPKCTLIAPFGKFHGKVVTADTVGGQVLYSIGGAQYSRAFVDPANPQSTLQVLVRAYMTQASQGWHALSEVNADAWRDKAVGVERKNILGQTYELTGENLYCLINCYRLLDGQALLATPPALTAPGSITAVTAVTVDDTNVTLVFTHTLAVGDFFLVRFAPDLGGAARNGRRNDCRIITDTPAASVVAREASPQTAEFGMGNFMLHNGDNTAVLLTPLGPTYYPGTDYLAKNVPVTATA